MCERSQGSGLSPSARLYISMHSSTAELREAVLRTLSPTFYCATFSLRAYSDRPMWLGVACIQWTGFLAVRRPHRGGSGWRSHRVINRAFLTSLSSVIPSILW